MNGEHTQFQTFSYPPRILNTVLWTCPQISPAISSIRDDLVAFSNGYIKAENERLQEFYLCIKGKINNTELFGKLEKLMHSTDKKSMIEQLEFSIDITNPPVVIPTCKHECHKNLRRNLIAVINLDPDLKEYQKKTIEDEIHRTFNKEAVLRQIDFWSFMIVMLGKKKIASIKAKVTGIHDVRCVLNPPKDVIPPPVDTPKSPLLRQANVSDFTIVLDLDKEILESARNELKAAMKCLATSPPTMTPDEFWKLGKDLLGVKKLAHLIEETKTLVRNTPVPKKVVPIVEWPLPRSNSNGWNIPKGPPTPISFKWISPPQVTPSVKTNPTPILETLPPPMLEPKRTQFEIQTGVSPKAIRLFPEIPPNLQPKIPPPEPATPSTPGFEAPIEKHGEKHDLIMDFTEEPDAKRSVKGDQWTLLEILRNLQEDPLCEPFKQPVDLVVYPDYNDFVRHPMDIETITKKVLEGSYSRNQDCREDILQMWTNCELYNDGHDERQWLVRNADKLREKTRRLWKSAALI
jgi:hypothetical protein